jgi:NAD(P)H-flavin reductase
MSSTIRYKNVTTVVPMVHIAFEPCRMFLNPIIAFLAGVRIMLSRPMYIRLVPKFLPVIPLPYLREISYFTIGELLLYIPIIFFLFEGYVYSFVSVDLDNSGKYASYAIYATFFTANKSNNLLSLVLGIPFERLIPLHIFSSFVAIVNSVLHVYVAYMFGGTNKSAPHDSIHASFGTDPNLIKFFKDGIVNLSGSILTFSIIMTFILSITPIRRIAFQIWLCSHILFAMMTIIFLFLHGVTTVVFIMLWWILDVTVRYVVMASYRNHADATLELLSSGEEGRPVIRVSFPKPKDFDYSPGQFVQVAFPALSALEFHPVSLASAPHEDSVTVCIRCLGDWTESLRRLAAFEKGTKIFVEGPYGSPSIDLEDSFRYRHVLLVAGGIGNTVCESIGKSLIKQYEEDQRPLVKLRYIWAVRKLDMVRDMPPLGGFTPVYEIGNDVVSIGARRRRATYATALESSAVTTAGSDLDYSEVPRCSVDMDIHCTRGSEDHPSDVEVSPPYSVHTERPDFDSIFLEMKEFAIRNGDSFIAVVACGPQGMVDLVREACRKHSDFETSCKKKVVYFELHTERFEF